MTPNSILTILSLLILIFANARANSQVSYDTLQIVSRTDSSFYFTSGADHSFDNYNISVTLNSNGKFYFSATCPLCVWFLSSGDWILKSNSKIVLKSNRYDFFNDYFLSSEYYDCLAFQGLNIDSLELTLFNDSIAICDLNRTKYLTSKDTLELIKPKSLVKFKKRRNEGYDFMFNSRVGFRSEDDGYVTVVKECDGKYRCSIDCYDYRIHYDNCSIIYVAENTIVRKGELIGLSSSKGKKYRYGITVVPYDSWAIPNELPIKIIESP